MKSLVRTGASLIVLMLLLPLSLHARQKDLLSRLFSEEQLRSVLVSQEQWHPFPRCSERDAWTQISPETRRAYVAQAEKYLHGTWQSLPASEFLGYVRDGNRSRYQALSFGRREQLASLVLGECMEGKGRFLDDIMNGVWAICEETFWGVPAHLSLQARGSGLPDVKEPVVDLFAAETGMLIAWTYYLVGDQLNAISPLVTERMRYEVDRRIIAVNLSRDDFWWMGFSRTVNNWNPWICSNWLTAVLVFEQDPVRRSASVHKILRCLDNFLNPYPADGGCDEGPSYWGRAGGSLYDCLELLQGATNNRINVFDVPLIGKIGRYIYRASIHGKYFINFADAPATLEPDASLVFRYGRSIHDLTMMKFGAYLAGLQHSNGAPIKGQFGTLGRILPALFTMNELAATEAHEPLLRDFWLPELQVMGSRDREGSWKGFFIAAQGGNNNESHNHNDVGNFVVYFDGDPVIIDVGVETYTAKTFSADRYAIWTMQSAYHNLPTINGFMQMNGAEYRAREVSCISDSTSAIFNLDIAGAYPAGASVLEWKRTLRLNRGKDVVIRDRYVLGEFLRPFTYSLMTSRVPTLKKNGTIDLASHRSGKSGAVSLFYDQKKFDARIEPIKVKDGRLQSSWGKRIYRIMLTSKTSALADEFSVRIGRE